MQTTDKTNLINYSVLTKPAGFSGCFRLRNESEFMEQAVLSWLPYLTEAVLVVQPSDDDTVERALKLEANYAKIRLFYYPHIVDWIDTAGFYNKDPNEAGHLVHMSNFALSQCRYNWIVKVEGDVIALPEAGEFIEYIGSLPAHDTYYGMYVLNLAGANCDQFSKTVPRNGGWDEAIFPNNPAYYFERVSKWEQIALGRHANTKCLGWGGMHMKRCKAANIGWNNEQYLPLNKENVEQVLAEYNLHNAYHGSDGLPLGVESFYDQRTYQ